MLSLERLQRGGPLDHRVLQGMILAAQNGRRSSITQRTELCKLQVQVQVGVDVDVDAGEVVDEVAVVVEGVAEVGAAGGHNDQDDLFFSLNEMEFCMIYHDLHLYCVIFLLVHY